MTFEWDEAKRRSNLAKHGLDFADVEQVFAGFIAVVFDVEHSDFEDRWTATGMLGGQAIVVVVYTEPEADVVRVVSFRKAKPDERRKYEAAFANRLGQSRGDEG